MVGQKRSFRRGKIIMMNYETNLEKQFKKVHFACNGSNTKMSNNEALNAIVKHLGITK